MASKGSAESNQETGTKRYLRPLDAFSGLSVSNVVGAPSRTLLAELIQHSPRPSSLLSPFQEPLSGSQISRFPPKFLAMTMGSVSNRNAAKGFTSKKRLKNTGVK